MSSNFSWKRYAHGRYREYSVAGRLMEAGYWVFRSQKSLGPADLTAIKSPSGPEYLIQVKMRRKPNIAKPEDYDLSKLVALGAALHDRVAFAGNDDSGHVTWYIWDLFVNDKKGGWVEWKY